MSWRSLVAVSGVLLLVAAVSAAGGQAQSGVAAGPSQNNTALPPNAAPAQSAAQSASQNAPGTAEAPYTFHADTRVVLTDVTVTDDKGNPVRGLPQAAFRLFDNKKEQRLLSFEEHARSPKVEMPAGAHGVYSNDYLLHLPPALNVIVLDIANLRIEDQMYLNYELTRFLKRLPEGEPLAIYLRASEGCFLVQGFTTDKELLLAGLHRAIPRFPPLGREYLSDEETLREIAVNLSQLPGRKNVLWFSGGSTAYLRPDATLWVSIGEIRAIYDELETERIAIYPIDARGLTITSGPAMWAQHGNMEDVAQATGGHAFYDSNGLDLIAGHLMDTDGSFYTLTYSPNNFKFDNKWHKVQIKLDGGNYYHLSYRTGYFADGSIRGVEDPARPRTRLMAGGVKVDEQPIQAPIIFQAEVLPASDPAVAALPAATGAITPVALKKDEIPYAVRYSVPLNALTGKTVDGKQQYVFGVAAIVIDHYGSQVQRQVKQLTLTLSDASVVRYRNAPVDIDEQLGLKKDDEYLYLAVWDQASGHLGTLQVPVDVRKRY